MCLDGGFGGFGRIIVGVGDGFVGKIGLFDKLTSGLPELVLTYL
jgi:hypothetical protein